MSVTLHTTLGDIKLELFCELIEKPCYNFLALAASGQYDGAIFHRNIKDFMVQAGIPNEKGIIKKGTSIWGGKFKDVFHPSLKHATRGMVSFANSGPDTNGSQFFICYKRHEHLDGKFTIFAKVIDGFSVLDAMEAAEVNEKSRPLEDIIIQRITIHANPLAK